MWFQLPSSMQRFTSRVLAAFTMLDPLVTIILPAILGNLGAALGHEISFSPDWNPIFINEDIALTCNVDSSSQDKYNYSWYKDRKKICTNQRLEILSAEWSHAGSYQCQAGAGDVSEPVRLNITDDALILQAPPSIFEGENLTLRCHSLSGTGGENTVFYKDGRILGQGPNEYHLKAELNSTGNYKCTKQITRYNSPETQKAERHISVTELFSSPDVAVSADPVTEGSEMTVSCATRLNPRRANTKLEFAFYRNGLKVQGFTVSDTYKVQSVQEEDAGSYTCEAKTSSNHMKRSQVYHVNVIELFSYPVMKVTSEGDNMTLICDTALSPSTGNNTRLEFAFYESGRKVREFGLSNEYQVESVQTGGAGHYSCEVRTSTNHVSKMSHVTQVDVPARSLRILMPALIWSFLVVSVIVTALLVFRHRPASNSFSRGTQQLTIEPKLEEIDVSYAPVLVNRMGEVALDSGTENVDAIIYAEVRNTDGKLCSYKTEQRNP